MEILELIDKIRNTEDSIVHSPCGLPIINKKNELPDDLKVFYENCGGITFFSNKEYEFTIVSPEEFVLANSVINGAVSAEKWTRLIDNS